MEKFGILVSFPASIMFTVEAESQEAAEEIIKNIVDEFNPDDVKLEYDANLRLLKTTETIELNNHYAELEKIAEAVTKIPADEMIAILQDLMYFSDALLEYIYDDDTVIVTSLNFPHDTYESEDDYRHVYSAEDFIAKMTRHLLFHKDVRKKYQQQFIKVMKGLMAVSYHFDDLSWVNESVEQNGLAEGREDHKLLELYRLIKRTPPDLIVQVLNDLSFFRGILIEYNHEDNTVTLIVRDDSQVIQPTQPARKFVDYASSHILFGGRYDNKARDEFIVAVKGMYELSAHFDDLSWANEAIAVHDLTKENIINSLSSWLHSNIIATNTMYGLAAIIENIDVLSTAIKVSPHFRLAVDYERRSDVLHKLNVIIDKNIYKYNANEIDRFKEDLIINIPVLTAMIYDAKFSKIKFDSLEGKDKLDRVLFAINYIFDPARYPIEFTLHDLDEDLDWVNESRKGKDYE